jgi:predicted PurR-regulated permease PerM
MGAPHERGESLTTSPPPAQPTAGGLTIFERHWAFWIVVVLVLLASLWWLRDVMLPFVAGMGLAYLLDPVTTRLERLGIKRGIAAVLTISVVVLSLVLLILLIAPIIGSQLAGLVADIPDYVRRLQSWFTDPARPWAGRLMGNGVSAADRVAGELATQGAAIATGFLSSLWTGGAAVISILSLLIVTPVVAFYFLVDWSRIVTKAERLIPRPDQPRVRQLAREIDTAVAGFVRGQAMVCLILGVFYALALSLVGLRFGLLIGLVAGLISFIPYVGTLVGLVLSVGVAISQFWPEWTWIVVVAGIFFVGQFIEDYVLIPKLVGENIGLHPLWIMFALFAFGYLFGFIGLLIAVPVAAALGVIIRFATRRYLESPVYTGEEPR